jgi:hypothetical protein
MSSSRPLRRARGALLRLARRRALSIAAGVVLLVPVAWVALDGRLAGWWVDGLSVILGATGAALIWSGLTGPRPDWVDQ